MSYRLTRPLLFALPPEWAHGLTLGGLDVAHRLGLLRHLVSRPVEAPVQCMGLSFRNRVGLAAGLDKSGDHVAGLSALGFGFIEVGTVTPEAQPGNPKPRLFRLVPSRALINRMGFNNKGLEHLVRRVRASPCEGVLGINIGRNAKTPARDAARDYLACLEAVYGLADYVAVNVSSPNTEGLRRMQAAAPLNRLLEALAERRAKLRGTHSRYVPMALKLGPDLDGGQLRQIAAAVRAHGIDAVIATNTTTGRDEVRGQPLSGEDGGLSGAPLLKRSTAVLRILRHELGAAVTLIGCGGVMSGTDAVAKRRAGADLVQFYSGLIYRGPSLVSECAHALA